MTPTALEIQQHEVPRPAAKFHSEEFRAGRPQIGRCRGDSDRGGKDLGCPTANLPDESITPMSSVANTGVYYGYAQVVTEPTDGFKPEDVKEIHIMHDFDKDFYGYEMRAIVLGYIRPELDYVSREALIEDIEIDKRVALNCLERPEYRKYSQDPRFKGHSNVDSTEK
ncbi:hypothetical protein NMY22_g17372 [Coprinellus aureogranulatus]|nr:hypothetical protein NMY22_g17372 [Coprinellus aureogranulatus]